MIGWGGSATCRIMSKRNDPTAMAYDPFGEPVEIGDNGPSATGDLRTRNIAVVGFWLVAATLTAGRIYFAEQPVSQMVASAQAQVVTLLAGIL